MIDLSIFLHKLFLVLISMPYFYNHKQFYY
ncbi:Uncharacterised protein [Enterobacter bugandensis]|uniref:Uncharacterized protein n=1 Tax=Enterobacter bugandensis TaxID=881260 RepID=A0A822X616_9ENTR|nr:Uncharacterised protein [Enterobacter bugandensis]